MKKISAKKPLILSMILIAVSAVTAAVLPSKYPNTVLLNSDDNGTLLEFSGGGGLEGVLTCTITNDPEDVQFSCHETANSTTGVASEFPSHRTVSNTSHSDPDNLADTTSTAL